MLPVTIARSVSDRISLCYLLPVFWMMSYFHIVGPLAGIKGDVMLRINLLAAVPVGHQTTTVFSQVDENAILGQSLPSTIDLLSFFCVYVAYAINH